jgi:hypothetical protein
VQLQLLLHRRLKEGAQWEVSSPAFLNNHYGHEQQGVEGTDGSGLDLCGSGWRPEAGFVIITKKLQAAYTTGYSSLRNYQLLTSCSI